MGSRSLDTMRTFLDALVVHARIANGAIAHLLVRAELFASLRRHLESPGPRGAGP